MKQLQPILTTNECSLYHASVGNSQVKKYLVSTPETRAICNDPFVNGIKYTRDLSLACTKSLRALKDSKAINLSEYTTSVFNILRGGLNFGLRDAVADAFTWNHHSSAFISAQRARKEHNPDQWFITESSYKKVHLLETNDIIFGDVVATGTSLEYALQQLTEIASAQNRPINSLLFFTIGGPRSHEILEQVDVECREHFPNFQGSTVVYFEGIFTVASPKTNLSIQLDGTDLVRIDSLMAPEFVESQYQNPTFPLERCTIYDAGSRSFDIEEYLNDVREYWQKVSDLATKKGVSFESYLKERFPQLNAAEYGPVELNKLCARQIRMASINARHQTQQIQEKLVGNL